MMMLTQIINPCPIDTNTCFPSPWAASPCVCALISSVLLIKKADTFTSFQDLSVQVPHDVCYSHFEQSYFG